MSRRGANQVADILQLIILLTVLIFIIYIFLVLVFPSVCNAGISIPFYCPHHIAPSP